MKLKRKHYAAEVYHRFGKFSTHKPVIYAEEVSCDKKTGQVLNECEEFWKFDTKTRHYKRRRLNVGNTEDYYYVIYNDLSVEYIDVDEYESKQPKIVDTFQPGGQYKKYLNEHFVELLQRFQRNNRRIIYLDSPHIYTTKILLKHQETLHLEELIVPNPDKAFLAHDNGTAKLFQQNDTICHHYLSSIYELMRDMTIDENITAFDVWMDDCCSFHGNTEIQPSADIWLMFSKRILPRQNGIFGVTFSLRDRQPVSRSARMKTVREYVFECAKQNDYKIRLVSQGYYYTMYFMFFVTGYTQTCGDYNNICQNIDVRQKITQTTEPQPYLFTPQSPQHYHHYTFESLLQQSRDIYSQVLKLRQEL